MNDETPNEPSGALAAERRAWTRAQRLAELESLEPLPPDGAQAWGEAATWERADLLRAHAECLEAGDVEMAGQVLSRMCVGDPGEVMRVVMAGIENVVDSDRLARLCVEHLRHGAPGARWWAVQELARVGGLESLAALVEALSDPVPEIAEEASRALAQVAMRHPSARPTAHAELAALAATPSLRTQEAIRALEALRAHERAEQLESEALERAMNGQPLRMLRTVRRCAILFRTPCPLRWEALAQTEDPDVRHCSVCNQSVYFCRTDEETIERALADQCVAREVPDAVETPRVQLGRVARPEPLSSRQREALRLVARERGIREVISIAKSISRRCPRCTYPLPSYRITCQVCGYEAGRG
jgi:hypothetical protein